MNKMIKGIFCGLLPVVFLNSVEIGRIGIVDMDRVYGSYRQDVGELKELEDLQKDLQLSIDQEVVELEQLKTEKISAQSRGDNTRIRQLDTQINKKAQRLQNLYLQGNRQLESKKASALQNDSFAKRVINVIREIAETEGYTHIFKRSDPNLLYYNQGFDITDQVIRQINK